MQVLKHPEFRDKPASKKHLASIIDDCAALRDRNKPIKIERITEDIREIQDELSELLEAFIKEHHAAVTVLPEPVLEVSLSPTVTPNAEIFHLISSNACKPNGYLSLTALLTEPFDLSLTLVNRFHRTHALGILASNLIYDFGDDIKLIYDLHTPTTCHSIKRTRLTFVEGQIELGYIQHLASVLPCLRELFVELWPRDPMREDKGNRSWGFQTPLLLQALEGVKARVVVELRWESDCQRFEREYVGWRGWRRRMGAEAEEVVGVMEEGMCRRSYELNGK